MYQLAFQWASFTIGEVSGANYWYESQHGRYLKLIYSTSARHRVSYCGRNPLSPPLVFLMKVVYQKLRRAATASRLDIEVDTDMREFSARLPPDVHYLCSLSGNLVPLDVFQGMS